MKTGLTTIYRRGRSFFSRPAIAGPLLIAAVTLLIYTPTLRIPPHFDDDVLLFENPLIKDPAALWASLGQHWPKGLTLLSFAANYQLSAYDTFSYHLINILLHLATGLMLYCLALKLCAVPAVADSPVNRQKNLFAFLAAFIFTVHPLQTEAVNLIWQRAEVLSGFFYLAAFLAYLSGRLYRKKIHYLSCLGLFSLGLFAKGTIITLPAAIFCSEVFLFRSRYPTAILAYSRWPLIALLLCLLIPYDPEQINKKISGLFALYMHTTGSILFPSHLFTEVTVLPQYLRLTFLPLGQNLDHDIALAKSFWETPVLLSALGLLAVAVGIRWASRKNPLAAFGAVLFFLYLIPTIIVPRDPMLEHRLYVSVAGFTIFIAAVGLTVKIPQSLRLVSASALIIGLCSLTLARNNLWSSPVRLWEDTVRKSPNKARPHQLLGHAYLTTGQTEKAVWHLQKALALHPYFENAYNDLGVIALQAGQRDQAFNYFQQAIAIKNNFAAPFINLGYIHLNTHDYDTAQKLFQRSLSLRSSHEGYLGLGNTYLEKKLYDRAEASYRSSLEFKKTSPESWYSLGNVYFYQQDFPRAVAMYSKAAALNPGFYEALYNIGMVYREQQEYRLSAQWFEKAFAMAPQRKDICEDLTAVYEELKETSLAKKYRAQCQP